MNREFSEELTALMPIVPHGISGVDCSGCIVAVVENSDVELRCNQCGATVGVLQVDIMAGLLGLDSDEVTCPHCGKVNTLPGFSTIAVYVCVECGKTVELETDGQVADVNDGTCDWYTFEGVEPIAVMRCDRCRRAPELEADSVYCGLCGKRSPIRSNDIIAVIEAWNAMVDPVK